MSAQEAFWNSWFGGCIAVIEIVAVLSIVIVAITLVSRRFLKASI